MYHCILNATILCLIGCTCCAVPEYSECKAIDGSGRNAKGKPCIFPFLYFAKSYNECTWNDAPTNKPWCSTMVNDSTGEHIQDNGHWGVCGEKCPTEARQYTCGFTHCPHTYDKDKEDQTWGIYEGVSSNCTMCKKRCDIETSFDCVGVECDYSDGRNCVWLKLSNCGPNEERPYSENYKTCIKTETQKSEKLTMATMVTVSMCVFGVLLGLVLIICVYIKTRKRRKLCRLRSHVPSIKEQEKNNSTTASMVSSLHYRRFYRLSKRLSSVSNSYCPKKDVKAQLQNISYNSTREIKKELFEVGDEIGRGNFGKVFKGNVLSKSKHDSVITVAIKNISGKAKDKEMENALDEIKIMSIVDPHLNLVSMVGACTSELKHYGEVWLLLEFCQFGNLREYVMEHKNQILFGSLSDPLNCRSLLNWAYDIANGMQCLAKNQIMHGDLAARNILMYADPSQRGFPVAKVADFGLSKQFYDNIKYEKESRVYVAWKWMALEYLTRDYFTLTSDVWSFGVLFWEMLAFGRTPYGHQEYDELVDKLKLGYRLLCPDEMDQITYWYPQLLFSSLSEMCFKPDPMDRASFSDVLNRIEKELTPKEVENYNDMKCNYQLTRSSNYFNKS